MGDQHALRAGRGRQHPDRAIRQLQHRTDEERLPHGTRPALRPGHAGDLGGALQLLVPGPLLAGAAPGLAGADERTAVRRRGVFRAAAELPPPRVADPVPVRRLAGAVQDVLQGPGRNAVPAGTGQQHVLLALRDVAAHERPRLSQQEPGQRRGVRQLARRVRARPVGADRDPEPGVRAAGRQGGRRVAAAERERAADRERVLQLHPPKAHGAFGRATDPGTGACGSRVRRDALARRRRVRSRRHQPEQDALPRGLRRAVRAQGEPAHRARGGAGTGREPRPGRAPRARARPGAGPRRPAVRAEGMGQAAARGDGRHLRAARPR